MINLKPIVFLLIALQTTIFSEAQIKNTLTAQQTIDNAITEIGTTHKKVFVKFSASWCGWCKKMEAALLDNTVAPILNKYYVFATLVVEEAKKDSALENAGGRKLKAKYGGATMGLPYWCVLDGNQNLIANSKIKKSGNALLGEGNNVGCPTEGSEIDYFLYVLKQTSIITNAELAIVKARFLLIGGS